MHVGPARRHEFVFPAVSHHPVDIELEHAVVGLLVMAVIAKELIDAAYKPDELSRQIIALRIHHAHYFLNDRGRCRRANHLRRRADQLFAERGRRSP